MFPALQRCLPLRMRIRSITWREAQGLTHLLSGALLEQVAALVELGVAGHGGAGRRSHREAHGGDGASLGVYRHTAWCDGNEGWGDVESLRGDVHSCGPDRDQRLHTNNMFCQKHGLGHSCKYPAESFIALGEGLHLVTPKARRRLT